MMKPDEEAVFATLTGAEDTLSPQESRNGLRHVAALSMTKLSDGLLNPKLVLAWLAHGKTNREIAQILELSPRTVNKHLEQIFRKLGVENRTAAAAMVIQLLTRY